MSSMKQDILIDMILARKGANDKSADDSELKNRIKNLKILRNKT